MEVDYQQEIAQYPVWVAEQDGMIVGGLILMFEEGFTTIANVAVHPHTQGTGLGRRLLEMAEVQALEQGDTELRQATHVLLSENISFYTHLGWQELGQDEMRVYFRNKIDIVPSHETPR